MAKKKAAFSRPNSKRKTRGQASTVAKTGSRTGWRDRGVRSEGEEKNSLSLPSSCRYRQVGENASALLLSVVSATGLTVKEKLGGERECGVYSERERERMGGP